MLNKIKKIISFILLFVVCLIFFSVRWILKTYDNIEFEEILFHLNPNLTESGTEVLMDYLTNSLIPSLILAFVIFAILFLIYDYIKGHDLFFNIKIKSTEIALKTTGKVVKFLLNILIVAGLGFFLITSVNKVGFSDYVKSQMQTSNFIENNYVDPEKVNIVFPEQKRNLIYIFVESLESSYFSEDLGGLKDENVLYELTDLTRDNTNFSNTDQFGGAYQGSGLSWTTAGMVGQTSGIPLKIPNDLSNETHFSSYLPGAYSIGNVLEKEGYNQTLMIGSYATFGNRDVYFKSHGNYFIFDYAHVLSKQLIPSDYHVWWGYEDSKLFDFAKDEITGLAKKEEPFNFTILTANSHFTDGYLEEDCESKFNDAYSNSIACSARQIKEFLDWLQKQKFYENTTVVIAGDHLTMQADYFDKKDFKKRTVYNLFINSALEDSNSKNRKFTIMDLYPTTLASLGVEIEGNRLGLGTNLYSGDKTIVEKYGLSKVNDEINKRSSFYNKNILRK